MEYIKTIVCFANSRKISGRCIAGKEFLTGQIGDWIRPVSARPTHEISEDERRYKDGRDPQLLDILEIPCIIHQPLPHQNENHLIDSRASWVQVGKLPWIDLHRWTDSPQDLWGVGQSSYSGVNNRLAFGMENSRSLYLLPVERLRLFVGKKAPKYPDSKRAIRGEFKYNGKIYRMDVTDPVIERNYLSHDDGTYEIVSPILCISLGDPFEGFYYKLIAAILFEDRCK